MLNVITYESDKKFRNHQNLLRKSVQYKDINLIVEGNEDEWAGTVTKLKGYSRALKEFNTNEVVILCDYRDVYFLANGEQILETFNKNNFEIIFNAECYCYPVNGLAEFYDRTTTKYKYLNSGVIMGKVASLSWMIEEAIEKIDTYDSDYFFKNLNRKKSRLLKDGNILVEGNRKRPVNYSDQFLIMLVYLNNKDRINLDYNCEMFQVLQIGNFYNTAERTETNSIFDLKFDYINGRIYNEYTETYPMVLHFPGSFSATNLLVNKFDEFIQRKRNEKKLLSSFSNT